MIELKGIAWDHERGCNPMLRTAADFSALHPDVRIVWRRRTLREFGDQPLESLIEEYDLLLVDHPFSGEAFVNGLYVPASDCIDAAHLDTVRAEEIGRVYASYEYGGRQMALPVDASAVVCACRDDLLEKHGLAFPETLEDVFRLGESLPDGLSILLPLCPTDIWCAFLSLGAAYGGDGFIDPERGIDQEAMGSAFDMLRRLAAACGRDPFALNPVNVLDAMAESDGIVLAPFVFGYVNYSISGKYRNVVAFYNSPLWPGAKSAPVLGGVGLAISSRCRNVAAAAAYARHVTLPEVQAGPYFTSGGQPAQRRAWLSERNNLAGNNYFRNTMRTMENAYLRPRTPGWNRFQEAGSVMLRDRIAGGESNAAIRGEMNRLFSEILREKGGRQCANI